MATLYGYLKQCENILLVFIKEFEQIKVMSKFIAGKALPQEI